MIEVKKHFSDGNKYPPITSSRLLLLSASRRGRSDASSAAHASRQRDHSGGAQGDDARLSTSSQLDKKHIWFYIYRSLASQLGFIRSQQLWPSAKCIQWKGSANVIKLKVNLENEKWMGERRRCFGSDFIFMLQFALPLPLQGMFFWSSLQIERSTFSSLFQTLITAHSFDIPPVALAMCSFIPFCAHSGTLGAKVLLKMCSQKFRALPSFSIQRSVKWWQDWKSPLITCLL